MPVKRSIEEDLAQTHSAVHGWALLVVVVKCEFHLPKIFIAISLILKIFQVLVITFIKRQWWNTVKRICRVLVHWGLTFITFSNQRVKISPVRFTIDNCSGNKRRHSGDGILVTMKRRFSVPVERPNAFDFTSTQVKSIQKLRLRQLKLDLFSLNLVFIAFIVTMVLWFPNVVVLLLHTDL